MAYPRWTDLCPKCRSEKRQCRGENRPTLADLKPILTQEIASYKQPRSLWFVDEIKRSPAGKPDYRWAKSQTDERPADEHAEAGSA